MRKMSLILASLALIATAGAPAFAAAPCRDAKGKFIKCPAKPAPAASKRCKNAAGKFAKCGTLGAKPV